jgi:hypothetical protein
MNACSHTVTRDDFTTSSRRTVTTHTIANYKSCTLQVCVLRWEQTEYGAVLPQGMTSTTHGTREGLCEQWAGGERLKW